MAVLSRDLQTSSLGNMRYQDLKHLHILAPAGFTTYRKTHPYTYPGGGPSLVLSSNFVPLYNAVPQHSCNIQ